MREGPSSWIRRWAHLVPAGSPVLDVAAGGGRHARLFASLGHPVTAVDRDTSRLEGIDGVEVVQADLEDGPPPQVFTDARYGGVVVVNYLHRPLLPVLVDAVAPDGVLLYATFMVGSPTGPGPSNPDFLLRPGELVDAVGGRLEVVAHQEWTTDGPRVVHRQAITARASAAG